MVAGRIVFRAPCGAGEWWTSIQPRRTDEQRPRPGGRQGIRRASTAVRATPVQSDPAALERLVRFAGFPPGSRILDAGCGPGLVCEALLSAGYRVVGVDLSREMIVRARRRCEPWSDRAEFHHLSLFDTALDDLASFDGALSRYVVHHVIDPLAFAARQVHLMRPGGTLVISDHLTDPLPELAGHHEAIERGATKPIPRT